MAPPSEASSRSPGRLPPVPLPLTPGQHPQQQPQQQQQGCYPGGQSLPPSLSPPQPISPLEPKSPPAFTLGAAAPDQPAIATPQGHAHGVRVEEGAPLNSARRSSSYPNPLGPSPRVSPLGLGLTNSGKVKADSCSSGLAPPPAPWRKSTSPGSTLPHHHHCNFPASGLSWPVVILLMAAVSAMSALVTLGVLSRDLALSTRPPVKCASTGDERYWRRFERQIMATTAPSPNKAGQQMVVLVTGAAGFVGSHVALALKERGDGVLGLDNFNNYYDPQLKYSREGRLKEAGIFVFHGDITNEDLLLWLFSRVRFTHVAHLAAQAGVRYAVENPHSYVRSNVDGFVSILEASRKAPFQPAIVWASSSSVYGLNKKVPFSEIHRVDKPASLYAATKKAGEMIAHSYNHIYGLSITGLRFFTVYGPWGRPDMAYFSFTKDILTGRPIKVFSGRKNCDVMRDFTYIDDIVNGFLASLDTAKPSTNGMKGLKGQLRVFNLGNTKPVSVGNLVDILESELKVPAKKSIVRMPRNGDVPFTHANVTAATTELGYRPTTPLQSGLHNFVVWYRDYYLGNNETATATAGSLAKYQ